MSGTPSNTDERRRSCFDFHIHRTVCMNAFDVDKCTSWTLQMPPTRRGHDTKGLERSCNARLALRPDQGVAEGDGFHRRKVRGLGEKGIEKRGPLFAGQVHPECNAACDLFVERLFAREESNRRRARAIDRIDPRCLGQHPRGRSDEVTRERQQRICVFEPRSAVKLCAKKIGKR